jgi:general secretion pathway protein G
LFIGAFTCPLDRLIYATSCLRGRLDNCPPIPNFKFMMPATLSSPSCPRPRPSSMATVMRRKATRAFTLLEILVVLAIIGLLAGLAISNIGGIFGGAQLTTASLFVKESMKTSLTTYRIHLGDYPTTSEGIMALVTAPANKADRWRGPYIEGGKVPLDPWGEPYQYRYPGTKNKGGYDLYSKGPDKADGTEDDIGNWDATAAPAK